MYQQHDYTVGQDDILVHNCTSQGEHNQQLKFERHVTFKEVMPKYEKEENLEAGLNEEEIQTLRENKLKLFDSRMNLEYRWSRYTRSIDRYIERTLQSNTFHELNHALNLVEKNINDLLKRAETETGFEKTLAQFELGEAVANRNALSSVIPQVNQRQLDFVVGTVSRQIDSINPGSFFAQEKQTIMRAALPDFAERWEAAMNDSLLNPE